MQSLQNEQEFPPNLRTPVYLHARSMREKIDASASLSAFPSRENRPEDARGPCMYLHTKIIGPTELIYRSPRCFRSVRLGRKVISRRRGQKERMHSRGDNAAFLMIATAGPVNNNRALSQRRRRRGRRRCSALDISPGNAATDFPRGIFAHNGKFAVIHGSVYVCVCVCVWSVLSISFFNGPSCCIAWAAIDTRSNCK